MGTLVGEKRKNDEAQERRTIPWWLILLVGFALGIVFTLSVSMGRSGNVTLYTSAPIADNFAEQSQQFMAEATLHAADARNRLAARELDPLLATATAIVSQATLQAAGSS